MKRWQIQANKVFVEIIPGSTYQELFKDYLFHRFRVLYSQEDKFHVPIRWDYYDGKLELEFHDVVMDGITKRDAKKEFPSMNKYSGEPSSPEEKAAMSLSKISEIYSAVSGFVYCCEYGIFGLSQIEPVNGKWIPPVSFFIPEGEEVIERDISRKDAEYFYRWLNIKFKSYIEFLCDAEKFDIKKILTCISNENLDEIKVLLSQKRTTDSPSFLDILTEAEFFIKIRNIYTYRRLSEKEADKYRNQGFSGEILELNSTHKDSEFGKLNRESPQELWDNLIESNRFARSVALSDKKKAPNPLIKLSDTAILAEWTRVHEDQPIISIRNSQHTMPSTGYLYVYEYGDIDQIRKKRKFINFAKRNSFLKGLLKISTGAVINNKENFWRREELADKILEKRGMFVIQGPPGTGKTHLATEVIKKFLKTYPYGKVLVCSKEHLALNHILYRITRELNKECIPFRAYRSLSRERSKLQDPDPEIKEFLQESVMKEIGNFGWNVDSHIWYHAQESYYKEYDLRNRSLSEESASIYFCTTMDSAFNQIINRKSYDLVVVEEAGKCYPSELLHTVCLGQRILLIGDQNQLPPFQIKETEEAVQIWEKTLKQAKNSPDLEKRLNERFGKTYQIIKNYYSLYGTIDNTNFAWLRPFETLFNILPNDRKHILNEQYRMEAPLSRLISEVFYDMEFEHKKNVPAPFKGIIPSYLDYPLLWIATPHMTRCIEAAEDPHKKGSKTNHFELKIIISYLKRLNSAKKIDIVILTPYNDQKDLLLNSEELKSECSKLSMRSFKESIKTIDEYQGHEADLTIISLVRNNSLSAGSSWGFITEPERLNVMFSRARFRQVIVGCSEQIQRNCNEDKVQFLHKLLSCYKKEGKFIDAEALLKND